MRILVLRGGALGDFIVTLPALAQLRAHWPDADIELIGNATAAQLATRRAESTTRHHALIDLAHSQHDARWLPLFDDAPLTGPLAAWLAEFDVVINYWPDPDAAIARKFPLRTGQRFLSAAAMPAISPAAAHYCAPLAELGITPPREYWHPLFTPSARPSGARRIAIHAGSGSRRKNWPVDRWAEICRWLKSEQSTELLLIAGEADPHVETLASFGTLIRNAPLLALAAELRRCDQFLGHDSGVSHLAAACGVSSLLLFGPTDPTMWAPPAPHVEVIRRGSDLTTITVEDVKRHLSRLK